MDVGFIGLGAMGRAMARNLVDAGYRVRAWNRSPGAGTRIDGLTMVPSPAAAFQADVVFTMLADDAAIRDVLLASDILGGARPGTVHVVTSTISVDFAAELARRHAASGIGYVAAPVLGRPDVAAAAQLNILAAGEASAIDRVRPLLDVLGKKTWVLGASPAQANAAKIAANMMITMAIEAIAEALVLTDGHGVEQDAFIGLILGTLFAGRVYENYSAKITQGDYEPGFRMRLGLKDLGLAADAKAGHDLPMLDAVRARMAAAVEAGMGDRDWSAIAHYTRHRVA